MVDGKPQTLRIGIPIFQDADLLDVTVPMEVLALIRPKVDLWLVSEDGGTVRLEPEMNVQPRGSFAACPQVDILIVPGGRGVSQELTNPRLLGFLRQQADKARWVTAICAGSLLLGVAGLLKGHTATTHWASLPALKLFPGVDVPKDYPRTVISRDHIITTGGVTSGLDMSIALVARLAGEQQARNAELRLEYAPEPPYGVGNPRMADETTLRQTTEDLQPKIDERMEIIRRLLRP